MIYVICFLISGGFFWWSEKFYNKEQFKVSSFFAIMGIITISLLAGARAPSIGRDINIYVTYAFNRINNYDSIMQVFQNHSLEIGYELLIYLCTRISSNVHFLHFVSSIIITSGFYSFVKYFANDNKYSIYYGMMTYSLIYFNTSLNIVRQFIALSIFLFSIKYLFQKKHLKFLIFVLLATQFHKSAILGIAILVLYRILNTKKPKTSKIVISIALTSFGLLFLDNITMQLLNMGIFSSKYMGYFSEAGNSSIFMQVLSRLPILLLGLFFYKKLIKHNLKNQIIYCFLIIDCILGSMSVVIGNGSRLSLYFGVWQCVFIPELLLVMKENASRKDRLVLSLFIHFYLFAYWGYCVVYRNFGSTFPYISDLFH